MNMTIMDKSALNTTTTPKPRDGERKSSKVSNAEKDGPIPTEEDELELSTIAKVHQKKQQQQEIERQINAFGQPKDLFENSSYNQHFLAPTSRMNVQSPSSKDQTASLVLMQDSMQFDDIKGVIPKKDTLKLSEGEPSPRKQSNNNEKSDGNDEQGPKTDNSMNHYMVSNTVDNSIDMRSPGAYSDQRPSAPSDIKTHKSNRSTNRSSKKTAVPQESA